MRCQKGGKGEGARRSKGGKEVFWWRASLARGVGGEVWQEGRECN